MGFKQFGLLRIYKFLSEGRITKDGDRLGLKGIMSIWYRKRDKRIWNSIDYQLGEAFAKFYLKPLINTYRNLDIDMQEIITKIHSLQKHYGRQRNPKLET